MLDYNLIDKVYVLDSDDIEKIPAASTNELNEYWSDSKYISFKKKLKTFLYLKQNDRCAYCRNIIEANGYYEDLEHIVPQSLKPSWTFNPKNIILTCPGCNRLKGDVQTLNSSYIEEVDVPAISEAFIIFNPYIDKWSDHLKYENELFLVGVPNSKGTKTIILCKLYRFHIIIARSKELKLGQKEPLSRCLEQLLKVSYNSEEKEVLIKELNDAIKFYLDRVEDKKEYL